MSHPAQARIPATYMRGGISKGTFFRLQNLPPAAQQLGAVRDALLMRVIGSPGPYGKQIDDMGGATSGTSKTAILSRSTRPGHGVDYLLGQIFINKPLVDWSGNCGDLSAAVGPFTISNGLIDASRISQDGVAIVRIQQANIGKTIIAHVPITNGAMQETGDFELDGVISPAVEVQLEFLDPTAEEGSDGGSAMFPAGNLVGDPEVPDVGTFKAMMTSAGVPTTFINAETIGYAGTELQSAINGDVKTLAMFEAIHAHGAVCIGPIKSIEEATIHQHTPKVAFAAPPKDYVASSGKKVGANDVDLLVRALSMSKLHHMMMGTAAVAIGTATTIPDTLVNLAASDGEHGAMHFGHPPDTLRVGAETKLVDGEWTVAKAIISRSARVLMGGWMHMSG